MKTCTTCKNTKPFSEFNKDRQKKDGLNPRCKTCSRAWHHKNKSRVREYQKQYYSKTVEYHSEKAKRYRDRNRDSLILASRRWHRENRDRAQEYRQKRLDAYRAYAQNRRARIKGNGGTHTQDEIKTILTMQRGKCAICLSELSDYHVDHIIPIAKGGTNDRYNLQVLCPGCNFSKNDSDPIEYAQRRGMLL